MNIKVAEIFYSIQGESVSAGVPAVFLRLSNCPLSCSFCDTVEVWKKGKYFTPEELYDSFEREGYVEALLKGAHLVITGGDPMLQQKALIPFIDKLPNCYIEVETQATVPIVPDFAEEIDQWNISPKLANSGMPPEKRLNLKVLSAFTEVDPPTKLTTAVKCFKFPVGSYLDVSEIELIVRAAGIRANDIYLMPICHTQASHVNQSKMVIEICKKTGWRYSPRLQLAIYDQAVGV